MRNIFLWVFIVLIISCGKKASEPAGTTTTGGSTKAVIKNGTTTVAHAFLSTDEGGIVAVYIPSADRYAFIELLTGKYVGPGRLYYFDDGCIGTPTVVSSYSFVGQVGKAVVYDQIHDSYYLVSAKKSISSYAFKSSHTATDSSCNDTDGTITSDYKNAIFDIVATTRPYNFEAIAPLTITYE